MKNKNKWLKYFLYVCLIGIGVIIGIAIRHYVNIPLEETINLVDIAALVVTVFLAVYIPEILDRKLQEQRDKKKLIENRITEIQSIQRRINSLVQNQDSMSEKNYLTLENELDVSLNKLETVSTLIKYANLGVSLEKEVAEIFNLFTAHRDLLVLKERQAKFFYSDEIQLEEERLYNAIDKTTSLLIFKVSDAKES